MAVAKTEGSFGARTSRLRQCGRGDGGREIKEGMVKKKKERKKGSRVSHGKEGKEEMVEEKDRHSSHTCSELEGEKEGEVDEGRGKNCAG